MKPLIGITPSPTEDELGHGSFYRYALSRTYVDAVRAAGGVPVILPTDQQDLDDVFPHLDGLLISGGGDLDPALYGASEIHETTYGIDKDRDRFEIEAFRIAEARDIPTLCICRGVQVMAVAMGGTLTQDIASADTDALEHRQHNSGFMRDAVSQTVVVAPGNPLAAAVGTEPIQINSFHHQAVDLPGPTLTVIAKTEDGVVEALWHPEMSFGVGVQWHPEMLAADRPEHAAIFRALVEAASDK